MKRNGATAYTAAGLAAALATAGVAFTMLAVAGVAAQPDPDPVGVVVLVAVVVLTALLLVGALLVIVGKPAGRWLVVAGGVLTVLGVAVALIAAGRIAVDPQRTWETTSDGLTGVRVLGGLLIAFALGMLALALSPATKRWCRPAGRVDYTAAAHRLERKARGVR